jgi:E3 ubiquitin-protein ligase RNF13
VLMGNNLTLSFDDIEASFAPGVKASGVNGIVYTAEPLNACGPLTIKAVEGPPSPFALIIRGGCTFDEKVKNAQDAGFKAAIVYDNENSGVLVSKMLQWLEAQVVFIYMLCSYQRPLERC